MIDAPKLVIVEPNTVVKGFEESLTLYVDNLSPRIRIVLTPEEEDGIVT